MDDVSPVDEAAVVAGALCRWLEARFGGTAVVAEPPEQVPGGRDSRIHLVRFAGDALPGRWRAPLVARVLPDAERYEQGLREASTHDWCADQGVPVPRVLAVAAPGEVLDLPVQVMERVTGTTMAAAMTGRPWTARAEVDRLARLHVVLHRLDGASSPLHRSGASLLDRRLSLVRRVVADRPASALADGLERVDALRGRLEGSAPSVCHGDFHPLNVLVDGPRASVLDWTDAGVGDRHGDVARTALLFRMAAGFAQGTAERVALRGGGPLLARRYLRSYRRLLPLDADRLRLWEPVHLLHAWAQVEAAMTAPTGAPLAEEHPLPPALGTWVRARFERRMAQLT